MSKNLFLKGIILCVISAIFWAVGGNFTQYIFIHSNFNFISLTSIRMLVSGLALTIIAILSNGLSPLKEMMKNKKIIVSLLIYAIFAQVGLQVPFFATIKYSSAAFATLIGTFAPVVVIFYYAITNRKLPRKLEMFLILVMLLGIFFVITSGNIRAIVVDIRAVIWGFISCFAYSFYLIYAKVFEKYPSSFIVGITMILGGLFLTPFTDFNMIAENILKKDILVFFILLIIIGTIIPFNSFLEATKHIGAKIASILSVLEPISSLFITIFIFNEKFTIIQLIGAILVIIAVIILSSIED
ncbi:DMT family transporter [Oceanivirga miroungae]|uniref:Putative inner membrane transporter YicL n=1 Tax=Oceanivirga miroungae TaxID=1130046 RepID=A0A6I8M7J7_9FUSO|nr:EamA family transporter [Oceanivirga miroungae]VWL85868.1 putative inner membrane transporter YicL [Oceanivirga miroungae]